MQLGGGLRIEMDRFGFALPKKKRKKQRERVSSRQPCTLLFVTYQFYFVLFISFLCLLLPCKMPSLSLPGYFLKKKNTSSGAGRKTICCYLMNSCILKEGENVYTLAVT